MNIGKSEFSKAISVDDYKDTGWTLTLPAG